MSDQTSLPPSLMLGNSAKVELSRTIDGARVTLRGPHGLSLLEIEIVLTADGPVVRARAAALEIESATDLVARCERFRIEARDTVDIVSGGTLHIQGRRIDAEATHGSARVRANDDVQLLGENVLLNCDASGPPMPAWALPTPEVPKPSVDVQCVSGAEELLNGLFEEP